MRLIKNIFLLVIVLGFTLILATNIGKAYNLIFGQGASYLDLSFLSGLSLAYILFLPLFFTIFGDEKKYWWIGILLIPAAIVEIYFDFQHLYFPIGLGLAGWVFGLGILKLKVLLQKQKS